MLKKRQKDFSRIEKLIWKWIELDDKQHQIISEIEAICEEHLQGKVLSRLVIKGGEKVWK